MTNPIITPVLLSGGAGTRLWPLSRQLRPKQFLALNGNDSMFRETVSRVSGQAFAAPLVICNDEHRFLVAEEMRDGGHQWQAIILEPVARNTAPAIAAAALYLAANNPDTVMAVLPSDHVIGDTEKFQETLIEAAGVARAGQLVAFGVPPLRPETGYGYIQRGERLAAGEAFAVSRFVEKPDAATAAGYIDAGDYLWNSGMFMFTPETFLSELEALQPAILDNCRGALDGAVRDLDFFRLDEAAFAQAEAISVDYAVMEKTRHAAVIPLETA